MTGPVTGLPQRAAAVNFADAACWATGPAALPADTSPGADAQVHWQSAPIPVDDEMMHSARMAGHEKPYVHLKTNYRTAAMRVVHTPQLHTPNT